MFKIRYSAEDSCAIHLQYVLVKLLPTYTLNKVYFVTNDWHYMFSCARAQYSSIVERKLYTALYERQVSSHLRSMATVLMVLCIV